MENALTIDVEDYFHVAAFADNISRANWDKMQCRVEINTNRLIELFSRYDIRATFFILGWVAERYPDIVRQIALHGHEVACHGYSHQLIYKQTTKVFNDETKKAKEILENITGSAVIGYRAASYSITKQSLWATDTLTELGFKYDSSIIPVRHDLYGIPGLPRFPHQMTAPGGGRLVEFPPSTLSFFGFNLPIAGGGYFRLYPYWFSKAALKWVNRHEKMPFIFYLHPWEVDPNQPRVKTKWLSRFRHYNNLDKCQHRLEKLIGDFNFTTVRDVLVSLDLMKRADPQAAEPSLITA